jgi:hypothetical protein
VKTGGRERKRGNQAGKQRREIPLMNYYVSYAVANHHPSYESLLGSNKRFRLKPAFYCLNLFSLVVHMNWGKATRNCVEESFE